ncbi:hypothetical protein LCGC14_1182370 [marine sediment metagenome]|uniref:Uncharacterized protein n=1 Tax=marine sediment metagenome TaxID=412755 RepID=A0A0F9LRK3_9ZZZZ
MADDNKPPHLKVIDAERQRREEEELRNNAYKRRSNSQKDFYAEARMNIERIRLLKQALLDSAILDEDKEILLIWSEKLIQEVLDSVSDPGPIRNKRKKI